MIPDAGLQPFLLPDERVRWQGHPASGIVFSPIDVFLIPFSLLWGGFALFWNISAWTANAPLDFQLFGLPFLIVGAYVIVGRFLVDAWIRGRTHYAVTNRRIIILKTVVSANVKSVDLETLPTLELQERRDGTGTIRLAPSAGMFGVGNSFAIWSPALDPTPQLFRIDGVRAVYELIRAQRSARETLS